MLILVHTLTEMLYNTYDFYRMLCFDGGGHTFGLFIILGRISFYFDNLFFFL